MVVTADRPATARRFKMLVGGDWVEAGDGATFTRTNPANGTIVGEYANGDVADLNRAVAAAREAFEGGWRKSTATQRHDILRGTAQRLRDEAPALAALMTAEVGKPLMMSMGEIMGAAETFDYYAALALTHRGGNAISEQTPDAMGLVLREPVGVVGMITPWNFPLILVSWKIGPAIAAGCTAVVKPSHYTPGTTLELGRILLESGLPPGVVNIVTSDKENGAVVGGALAAHMDVDKIAFTGSVATGQSVMRAAASNIKKITLELGGKSPNIVFEDANLDQAVAGAFMGIYLNSGQVCQAGSRLLLQRSIRDQFLEKLVAFSGQMKMGDPMAPDTLMGPVINEVQLGKVMGYIDAGRAEGARVLCGGGRPEGEVFAQGLYVEPTIFVDVTNDMRIAREEIFGPVLSVITFDDAEGAVRIANDTAYGLAAAVWTQNVTTALTVAKELRAGNVWVNAYHSAGISGMPYGGYRQSGIGRELGPEGLSEYLETKSLQIKL